jgi:hypothetical protein
MIGGAVVASAWRRGVQYSTAARFLSIGLSAALCVAAGAAVVWRDVTDPYATRGLDERANLVAAALRRHDCVTARRALVATEAVADGAPEVQGLRAEVERDCPPGAR